MTATLAILGATGSIGTQALDVVARHPARFEVSALSARSRLDELVALANRHHPREVVVPDAAARSAIGDALPAGTRVLVGSEGLAEAASGSEVVLNAVVGFAGVEATLAALAAGRHLALANKESLVVAADLVATVRGTPGAKLLPVDSEHCAIHQCLAGLGEGFADVLRRIVITASGGPFRGRSKAELATVTVADALAHPTWQMGARITVDCSTLMNKGLEVLEATALFGVPLDRVDVVVHPQSIVHSMVELTDGSTLAQLSNPDMRLPIAYAMGYPERTSDGFGALALDGELVLTFEQPDLRTFRCLDLAREAGRLGGTAPAWLNAADERAVEAFLDGRIGWLDIAAVVAATLDEYDGAPCSDLAALLSADAAARRSADGIMEKMAALGAAR